MRFTIPNLWILSLIPYQRIRRSRMISSSRSSINFVTTITPCTHARSSRIHSSCAAADISSLPSISKLRFGVLKWSAFSPISINLFNILRSLISACKCSNYLWRHYRLLCRLWDFHSPWPSHHPHKVATYEIIHLVHRIKIAWPSEIHDQSPYRCIFTSYRSHTPLDTCDSISRILLYSPTEGTEFGRSEHTLFLVRCCLLPELYRHCEGTNGL